MGYIKGCNQPTKGAIISQLTCMWAGDRPEQLIVFPLPDGVWNIKIAGGNPHVWKQSPMFDYQTINPFKMEVPEFEPPQIIHFKWTSHFKPSILGYPPFMETPKWGSNYRTPITPSRIMAPSPSLLLFERASLDNRADLEIPCQKLNHVVDHPQNHHKWVV